MLCSHPTRNGLKSVFCSSSMLSPHTFSFHCPSSSMFAASLRLPRTQVTYGPISSSISGTSRNPFWWIEKIREGPHWFRRMNKMRPGMGKVLPVICCSGNIILFLLLGKGLGSWGINGQMIEFPVRKKYEHSEMCVYVCVRACTHACVCVFVCKRVRERQRMTLNTLCLLQVRKGMSHSTCM